MLLGGYIFVMCVWGGNSDAFGTLKCTIPALALGYGQKHNTIKYQQRDSRSTEANLIITYFKAINIFLQHITVDPTLASQTEQLGK